MVCRPGRLRIIAEQKARYEMVSSDAEKNTSEKSLNDFDQPEIGSDRQNIALRAVNTAIFNV